MEVCPYSHFRLCEYFWGPWCHLLRQMSSQWGLQKLLQRLITSFIVLLLFLELSKNFSFSNDLTHIVNFPTWIVDCDSRNPALLNFFLSSDASFCFVMSFPSLGISDHVVDLFSIDVPSNSRWDTSFHWISYDLTYWLGRSSWSFERCSMEDIFEFSVSTVASKFCKWVQVGIDVYIPHHKYQVKLHTSP